jgi:hypothetical protein
MRWVQGGLFLFSARSLLATLSTMVETRRSDEPLVETVDPDALARRHGGRAPGAVPERGRKQAARSPERFGESEARNPSYLEEILAKNGSTFTLLLMVRGLADAAAFVPGFERAELRRAFPCGSCG